LGEIMGILVQLHLSGPYVPSRSSRALVHALIHFLELALIFAVFYCIADRYCSTNDKPMFADARGTRSVLYEDSVTPLYFSVVSLATLGYGDYAPRIPVGKALVILQLFVQVVFVLVVFPKIVSAPKD
jgi:hypothetical protein